MFLDLQLMSEYFAAVEREKRLKKLHADRKILSALIPPFTVEQVHLYQDRIFEIETRLARWRATH